MTLLIRGGTVVNHDHTARADVLVAHGRIEQVAPNIAPPIGAEIIDAWEIGRAHV